MVNNKELFAVRKNLEGKISTNPRTRKQNSQIGCYIVFLTQSTTYQ